MPTVSLAKEVLPSLPIVQRAIVQDNEGRPFLAHDAALPSLRPNAILVKTAAVALNPSDYKMGSKFPSPGSVVGMDFAGSIVRMGSEVISLRPDLKIGDLVCGVIHGSNPAERGNGSFANYLLAPADLVMKVPETMRVEEAATLGVALATDCLALWESLGLTASPEKPTDKPYDVLVYGGSTACGTMAIQLLKLSGLNPISTCSPKNYSLVKSYGASAVFDSASADTPMAIRTHTKDRLRYSLDCITNAESVACCYAALGRTGGRYSCLELCPQGLQTRKAVKAEFVMGLDIFGLEIKLDRGYERAASPGKHEAGVHWFKMFQKLLEEGKLKTHPIRILEGGFEGIPSGLQILRRGISGEKFVVFLP